MSANTIEMSSPAALPLSGLLSQMRRDEPRLFAFGVMMIAAMPVTIFAGLVDPRTFLGIDVWEKPFKFELALAVFTLTMAFFARFLPAGTGEKRWYRAYSAAVVAMMGIEMIWIGGAAMLGTASHFNRSPVGDVIYSLMGLFAVGFTAATSVYAWQIARNRALDLSPAVKEGIVTGLALVLPLTLVTAGTMAPDGRPLGRRRAERCRRPGPDGLGARGRRSARGAFLRHACDALCPGLRPCVGAFGRPGQPVAAAPLRDAYVLLVLFAFAQALMGRPFLRVGRVQAF